MTRRNALLRLLSDVKDASPWKSSAIADEILRMTEAIPDDAAVHELVSEISAEARRELEGLTTDRDLAAVYATESSALLVTMANSARAWQANPSSIEAARELLRELHTLSGAASLVGLTTIVSASRALELQVSAITRSGHIPDAATFASLRTGLDKVRGMHDVFMQVNLVNSGASAKE